MSVHLYYLTEISTQLSDDTLDENGVITEEGTKTLTKNALLKIGNQNQPAHKKAHLRFSSDKQKIILEVNLPSKLTKAQACTQLAELLPWTAEQISNNTTFTALGGAGATYKESQTAAKAYIHDNAEAWGEA